MSDVTSILSAIEQGEPHAAEQLLPLVYDELRRLAAERLAHEKPGQTLQATGLVHEPKVRLVDQRRGLERLPGLFLRELLRRQFPQLLVDQRQELLRGVRITGFQGVQDPADLAHHPPASGRSRAFLSGDVA